MAIRITFPCPDCGGTDLKVSRSGNYAMKTIATFFLLKAFRCKECGNRNYFPSFLPDRRSQRDEFLEEESAVTPAQAEMLESRL